MRDIPVDLSGYRLMVTEPPALKMKRTPDGMVEPATDGEGANLYTVSLFAKKKGERGEEIRVTLATDPGDAVDEGDLVELIGATLTPYSFKNDRGETVFGIAFKAMGLKPVG